jgi:hypothetical protein
MTLELAYVTDTRHFNWRSVKLAYLIGRETGHLHFPCLRHQMFGWSPGCPIEHNRTLNLTGWFNVWTDPYKETSATLGYLSKTSKADGTAPEWHRAALSVPAHELVQAEPLPGCAASWYTNLEVFSDLRYIKCVQANKLDVLPAVTKIYTLCVV